MLGNARNAEIAEKQNQMLVNFFLTQVVQVRRFAVNLYLGTSLSKGLLYLAQVTITTYPFILLLDKGSFLGYIYTLAITLLVYISSLLLLVIILVTGHSRNTLRTSTYFHRLSNQKPITRLPQSIAIYRNLLFSTIFRCILPYSAKSTKSYQVLLRQLPKSYSALYIY